MPPESTPPISLTAQKWTITLPKLVAIMLALIGSGTAATVGYAKLATQKYVDDENASQQVQIAAMAEAHTATVKQVDEGEVRDKKMAKDIALLTRFAKIQYVHTIDEKSQRRFRKPRSAKAKRAAQILDIDPEDPLAGLQMLEGTD